MEPKGYDSTKLQDLRSLLFPAIGQGLLTGYNVFKAPITLQGEYVIRYFHSDLGPDDSGALRDHHQRLVEELEKVGAIRKENTRGVCVRERVAEYLEGKWRTNPEGVGVYSLDGTKLDANEFKRYGQPVVVEGLQSELSFAIDNASHLATVLDRFAEILYTNRSPIPGAWEIPLYVVDGKDIDRHDMGRVTEMTFGQQGLIISTLVCKKEAEIQKFLVQRGIAPSMKSTHANKMFIEDYLQT